MLNLFLLGKIKQLFRQSHCCEQAWPKQVQCKCIKNLENWLNRNYAETFLLCLRSGRRVTWNKKSILFKSVLPVSIKCDKLLHFWSKYKKLAHLLGYCSGSSLWIRVNFTLLVSEKSSLILLWPEHAHTYLSQLGHVSGKRTLPRLRTWKAEVKIFALRPPCWYGPQSSLEAFLCV